MSDTTVEVTVASQEKPPHRTLAEARKDALAYRGSTHVYDMVMARIKQFPNRVAYAKHMDVSNSFAHYVAVRDRAPNAAMVADAAQALGRANVTVVDGSL